MGCKVDVSADKVVIMSGGEQATTLLGSKYLSSDLQATADKSKSLDGDTRLSFTVTADSIVSLEGSVGESLLGLKNNLLLTGELSTLVTLIGNAPCTFFHIYCDTTYYFTDDGDVTCDRD